MARFIRFALGTICLVLSARAVEAANKEAEALQGKWQAVKGTRDGKPLTREDLAKFKIVLGQQGGRTGWQDPFMGASDPFHNLGIRLDLTTSPKRISLIRQAGLRATTYPGIFKLDAGRLIVCWNLEPWTNPDGPANRSVPGEFAAPRGSGFTLLTFEKGKE